MKTSKKTVKLSEKAKMRIAIAKDVINQIENFQYDPAYGEYCTLVFRDKVIEKDSLQKHLKKKNNIQVCDVCAKRCLVSFLC